MKVLETRTTSEGFKRRRYESSTGERSTTIEVPMNLWNALNKTGRAFNRVAQLERAESRRSLRKQAQALMANGWTPTEVSKHFGVPLRTVTTWKKKMKESQ